MGGGELSRKNPEIEAKSPELLRLGEFTFSVENRELLGSDGAQVALRSQSADVLARLARNRGRVVTKGALIEDIWSDTFVTDDSLVQCIADIRRALGDSEHRILQTFPKRGYRLIAEADPAAPGPASRFRTIAVTLALAATLLAALSWLALPRRGQVPLPTIAVLPFEDFSMGDDKGYLSDAIAEGIITDLARSRSYAVIARNSSFRYRDRPADTRQIARELGVNYVLEGSQQKAGDRLRVTAQLIDAATGTDLWANTYERKIGDLFIVQDEIIRTLADRVGHRIERSPPGPDAGKVGALYYYLKGRQGIHDNFTAENSAKLLDLGLKAIEVDPKAQYGYIAVAWAYRDDAVFSWHGRDRDEALRQALKYADKAVSLAPDDPEAYSARAHALEEMGRSAEARATYDKAIELNPSDSEILASSTSNLLYVGETDAAIARLEKAKGIDPFYPDWYDWQMGWALWEKHDCNGALAAMQRMSKIPKGAHRMLAGIYACLGDAEKARAAYRVFYKDAKEPTIAEQRAEWQGIWTAPGSLDRWLEDMRVAGMKD